MTKLNANWIQDTVTILEASSGILFQWKSNYVPQGADRSKWFGSEQGWNDSSSELPVFDNLKSAVFAFRDKAQSLDTVGKNWRAVQRTNGVTTPLGMMYKDNSGWRVGSSSGWAK